MSVQEVVEGTGVADAAATRARAALSAEASEVVRLRVVQAGGSEAEAKLGTLRGVVQGLHDHFVKA